jgi:hypothetical protein
MVAAIADAYRLLDPEEQAKCSIFCNNYGEAGAVDFYGPRYGLPKAISGHNNYWIWGPRGAEGEVVIRLGGSIEAMREAYENVVQAGVFRDEYCMPYENDQPIWICRSRHTSLKHDWANFKHFE